MRVHRIVLTLVVVAAALATPVHASTSANRSGAAATLTKPNIVLFLTDDQTMESFQHMPDVQSRTDWVKFDNAWVNNALCCPSRASILQGRYDTHTRVENNREGWRFDPSETLPVWLSRQGYDTSLIGKYLNGLPDPMAIPPGWSDFQVVVPNHQAYEQYNWTLNDNGTSRKFGSAPADYEGDVLAGRAKSYIATHAATGRPFFLYYAPTATHGPWVASPARKGMFASTPVPESPNFNETDVTDKPAYIRGLSPVTVASVTNQRRREWAAGVSTDDAFKLLDDQLHASGIADNTVVIFMTDNGFSNGNHRYRGKLCEYDECSRIPLLVRYPGVASHTDSHFVSNVDIASTIAEMGGATTGLPQDGRSLLPLILGQDVTDWRTGLLQHWSGGDNIGLTGHGTAVPVFWAVRGALDGHEYAYVELATGEKELYDEQTDPYEMDNVAGESSYSAVQSQLAAMLAGLENQSTRVVAGVDDRPVGPVPTTPLYLAPDD